MEEIYRPDPVQVPAGDLWTTPAPRTRFTRADLMQFPADAEPELPLLAMECCDQDVSPFDQARTETMQLCHYECPTCGRVWGHYFPLHRHHLVVVR